METAVIASATLRQGSGEVLDTHKSKWQTGRGDNQTLRTGYASLLKY